MKMNRLSLNYLGEKLQVAIQRFPLTFIVVIGLSVMLLNNICKDSDGTIALKWIFAGVFSALLTLSFYLFAEKKIKPLITNLINLVLMTLITLFLSTFQRTISDAKMVQIAMIGIALFGSLFFATYLTHKSSLRWWNDLQNTLIQLLIATIFSIILMGGLSLALVSLDKLFNISVEENVYLCLCVGCFVIFAPIYFMAHIQEKNISTNNLSIVYPKTYKLLALYILLPILAIYTFILYGYLVQIVLSWELPNGWVSWLVSVLGFAGFLGMIILYPLFSENSTKQAEQQSRSIFMIIGKIFTAYFPVILLPLVVLMFVGIVRRFSDYGITINRLLVLILNIWFFGISIFLVVTKSRYPKWILISFSAITFLSAIGSWSVINIAEKSLKNEFSELLSEASWYNNPTDKITPLPKEKQKRIIEIAYYLTRNYGIESIRPMFSSLGEKAGVIQLIETLNISEEDAANSHFWLGLSDENTMTDIQDFQRAICFSKKWNEKEITINDSLKIRFSDEWVVIQDANSKAEISISPLIEMKINAPDTYKFNTEKMTVEQNGCKLIVRKLDGDIKLKEVTINHMEGLLLIK